MLYYINSAIRQMLAGFLPALLFVGGLVFLFRYGGEIFRSRTKKKLEKASLSSLWLALGGTLGVGNICGVVGAVYIGGAGCVFWMWVCAILSAFTKYTETVFAVKHRISLPDGSVVGGAPYYIKNSLNRKKTANIFAVSCILTAFTVGCATQVKSAADIVVSSTSIPRWAVGSVFLLALLYLTLGKKKAVSAFATHTVPFLCACYGILCLIIIFTFRENIIPLTKEIVREAFTPTAGVGGILAFISSPALRLGITRGVMSSEAGCGTAPYAYASDPNANAESCGRLGVAEVLVDTLLLCTLTAYAVMLPKIPLSESSADTVIAAFALVFGSSAQIFLCISIFLFALASASSWSFYAEQSALFLGLKRFHVPFSIIYSVSAFIFCYVGESRVWFLSDITVTVMATVNILCLLSFQRK